jgi:hypothetical protein
MSFPIRTITAGIELQQDTAEKQLSATLGFLNTAREHYEQAGYSIQTLRIALQPLPLYQPEWLTQTTLATLELLDQQMVDASVLLGLGPVITDNSDPSGLADWAVELAGRTRNSSFSVAVGSTAHGLHPQSIRSAAAVIYALARQSPGGEANFRFAATACCPAGTPFFPAAWHSGSPGFSLGLESAGLVHEAFSSLTENTAAQSRLRTIMELALKPLEALATELAGRTGYRYTGIDTSPAPGLQCSISEAIEQLTGTPFGSPSTLTACAAITGVLKELDLKTCGYNGLMLPLLEDRGLAQRAAEGRFGLAELLLYSSVCGTGLDVIPLPGATSVETLQAIISDVASLSVRLQKPLSARLLPVPDKQAGEPVQFDNPHLLDAVVMGC